MELGTTVMGITLLVLCTLPFILAMNGQKSKQKKLVRSLQTLADPHQSKIADKDCYANFAIGVDESNLHCYYYKKGKEIELKNCIELTDVEHCSINKVTESKFKNDHVDKIELVLRSKDSSKPSQVLEFYNSDEFMTMGGELKLAQKWEQNLNNIIHRKAS